MKYLKESEDAVVSALTVEEKYINAEMQEKWGGIGLPIVPFETLEKHYPPEEYGILICIGYSQMNAVRERIFREVRAKGYTILSYTHPSATVLADALGEGTIVMERALIGAFVTMGVGNIVYPGAHIAHDAMIGDFNFFSISCVVAGHVKIDDHCFIGANCTVKNGIRISKYTLVGAGCYLSRDSEPYGVYVPERSVHLQGKDSRDFQL